MAEREVLTRPSVPFVDLGSLDDSLHLEILDGIAELVDAGTFINGPAVESFERAFARYCRRAHCVGCASGLDALRLGLTAAGLERGDEVLVPAQTFIATWEAVTQAGGTPVPVDISEADYGIDAHAAEGALGPRTRFVIPVHLYGQLADMRAVLALAERHGMIVVEDACQAHGAARDGILAGSAGHAAAFSFHPAKNLGAFGDAGALVTNDEALGASVRALREHGQRIKNEHDAIGYTARLDAIQAVVLSKKLPWLDAWNDSRRRAARFYSEHLEGAGDLTLPPIAADSSPVWHLYVVRTRKPARLAAHLAERGIATGRHYPTPPHLSPAYASLGFGRRAFRVAEALADEGLTLPIFPTITEPQLDAVVNAVREFFDG